MPDQQRTARGDIELLMITADPMVAASLESAGVDTVFVDLEVRGKAARQAGRNTVISGHSINDVRAVRAAVSGSRLLVRVNPWWEGSEDEIDAVLERLKTGTLDCIVQVQMLGEGFDHPRLSVAAIFRPYRSLAPYIQFVGRVMRVVQQNQPDHPDNRGFVVSHIGLNNDERWSEFRELDLEDQELIHDWTAGAGDPAIDGAETDGEGRARRFDNGMLVNNEILASFIDQAYLDPNDDRVLEEMLDREVAPGLQVRDIITLDQLRAGLLAKQAAQPVDQPLPIPISPQRKRQSARTRLNERAMSVANRVLQDLDLPRNGFALMKVTRGPRQSNLRVVTRLLNAAVTAELGDARGKASAAELTRVFDDLDAIADRVRDDIAKKL
jgi:hypothetical protein